MDILDLNEKERETIFLSVKLIEEVMDKHPTKMLNTFLDKGDYIYSISYCKTLNNKKNKE